MHQDRDPSHPSTRKDRAELRNLGDKLATADPDENRAAHGNKMGRGAGWRDDPANSPDKRYKRSVWEIATQPYAEAHFATFPEALVEPCILAGSSEKGCCPACGAPWKRGVAVSYQNPGNRTTNGPRSTENRQQTAGFDQRLEKHAETTGWSPTCRCSETVNCELSTVPCRVLDPFCGSGTTGVVALRYHRDFVGIELKPEYAELARERIGNEAPMFNEVELDFTQEHV